MARVNVREFKSRLSYYLELCQKEVIEVTNWGNVVANVVTPQENLKEQNELLKKNIKELELQLKNKPFNVVTASRNESPTMGGKCEVPSCKRIGSLKQATYIEHVWDTGEEKKIPMMMCAVHYKKYNFS